MANTPGLPSGSAVRLRAMSAAYPASGLKLALYLATATITGATTVYTTTGEVTGAGYTAGGATVNSSTAPAATGNVTYFTPAASITWTNVSIGPFDVGMLYDTNASNQNLGVFAFGGSQSVVNADFTLNMPTNNSTSALVRWTWS